jgi:hypothetical protein
MLIAKTPVSSENGASLFSLIAVLVVRGLIYDCIPLFTEELIISTLQEGGRDINSTYYSLPHYALKIKDYG